MRNTILKYGMYGAVTICVLFLASWVFYDIFSNTILEVIGYTSMVVSLSFVFFGIKHYRDQINNGFVSFGKAITIGVAISVITAFAFGLLDVIYVKYINPDFTETYYADSLQELKETLPAETFEVKRAELETQKELFMNPWFNFALMAGTVLVIGFIITLISSLILQNNTQKL